MTHVSIRDGTLPVPPCTQQALRYAVAAGVDLLVLAVVLLALVLRHGDVLLA